MKCEGRKVHMQGERGVGLTKIWSKNDNLKFHNFKKFYVKQTP